MIYHYTSIDTLALILESQKIRFSRLDQVDDLQESQLFTEYKIFYRLFVSCWTEDPEENIALWNMYTPNMKGVRIGFKRHPLVLPEPEITKTWIFDDYMILPLGHAGIDYFKKVEYVSESVLETRIKASAQKGINDDGSKNASIGIDALASLKNNVWQFQQESRYILFVTPPNGPTKEDHEKFMKSLLDEELPEYKYISLPIKPDIFPEMEILLGPKTTKSDEIIVESLLTKYGIQKRFSLSKLKGQIRT